MGATGTPGKLGGGITPVRAFSKGQQTRVYATVTMSSSYATGGDTLTLPDDAKGLQLVGVNVLNPVPTVADRVISWNGDKTTPKLIAMVMSTGVEVANATNLSAVTVAVEFIFES